MASVRGSSTGRPIMVLLDLLGRRWTLRLLWELRDGAPQTFGALRVAAGEISTSVLATRLRELSGAGLVERDGEGYALTVAGAQLLAHLGPLDAFAKRHLGR